MLTVFEENARMSCTYIDNININSCSSVHFEADSRRKTEVLRVKLEKPNVKQTNVL